MVAFNTIKAGDILWDCHRTRMGNTSMARMGCWQVRVVEVYPDTKTACVSWSGNPTKIYRERDLGKLRRTKHPKAR